VVALETGGTPLERFSFPPAGVLIVGSEERGIGPELLARAEKSAGRVSISMRGKKNSLNVGVACGIALNRWVEQITMNPDLAARDLRAKNLKD
jgi:TrmH family RNA methyltransferase